MNDLINSIKKDINEVIDSINIGELVKVLKYANQKYYNEVEVLTDNEYDILHDLLKKKVQKMHFLKISDRRFIQKIKKNYHTIWEVWIKSNLELDKSRFGNQNLKDHIL